MYESTKEIPYIGIVVSEFNWSVSYRLLEGVRQGLSESSHPFYYEDVFWVPGAIEIPVVAQHLAKSGRYRAVIVLGAVIRGETSHYDSVCDQVSQGCQRVALDYGLPVIFGVLTTENVTQALDRSGGKRGNKGKEVAQAALSMIRTLDRIARLAELGALQTRRQASTQKRDC